MMFRFGLAYVGFGENDEVNHLSLGGVSHDWESVVRSVPQSLAQITDSHAFLSHRRRCKNYRLGFKIQGVRTLWRVALLHLHVKANLADVSG